MRQFNMELQYAVKAPSRTPWKDRLIYLNNGEYFVE